MPIRACARVCCLLLFTLAGGTSAQPIAQPVDSAIGEEAPSYDSEYAAGMHLRSADENTPEADGRPGEYYFLQGAHAFAKKDYRFAIQMYEVAASWAYKPAEYNLGVIYARGEGVPVDLPRAMAWMALAAERNDKRYVDAREKVYASLDSAQFAQANAIWRDLKKTYGDEIALRRAKARWEEVRTHITGSRVGFVGHLDVGVPAPGSGNTMAGRGVHKLATTPGEIFAGGDEVDGVIAYRQLLATDNPYDPKLERQPLGTATVEPLQPLAKPAAEQH